jgi:hypothetical protein
MGEDQIGDAQPNAHAIDRTVIRELRKLTFAERARLAVQEARNLAEFDDRLRQRK